MTTAVPLRRVCKPLLGACVAQSSPHTLSLLQKLCGLHMLLHISSPCSFGYHCVHDAHQGPRSRLLPTPHWFRFLGPSSELHIPDMSGIQYIPHPGQSICLISYMATRGPISPHCPISGSEPSTTPKSFLCIKVSLTCKSVWVTTPSYSTKHQSQCCSKAVLQRLLKFIIS